MSPSSHYVVECSVSCYSSQSLQPLSPSSAYRARRFSVGHDDPSLNGEA